MRQPTRLNKLLARYGLCSRREADRYIGAGLVEVNGRIVDRLGAKVDSATTTADDIRLLPAAARRQASLRTVLLHKPLGVVSCQPERPDQVPAIRLCTFEREYRNGGGGEERVRDRDNEQRRSADRGRAVPSPFVEPRQQGGWAVAGRLDVNSTGLLVLTQSGRIASQLIGEGTEMEKEYLVRLREPLMNVGIDDDRLVRRNLEELSAGIHDGGDDLLAKSVDIVNENQLRIILTEGKRHHIRRMCQGVGWHVSALKRVRIGNVALRDLPAGYWRYFQPRSESF